jgi:hypothetical protein
MSNTLRAMILILLITISVEGSNHRTRGNSKSPAQIPKVSTATKKKLLRAIKSIYGAKEPVTIEELQLRSIYPGFDPYSGLLLLRTKRASYLLRNACDNDWSEMDIYIYNLPHIIKPKGKRQCISRRLKIREVQITLK